MTRVAALFAVTGLLLSACGSDDSGGGTTTTVVASASGTIHLSGGLEGRDETWVIAPDGTVLGPDGYLGQLRATDMERLDAAVTAAGFFDLDDDYLPDDLCCDRFIYEVTITRGGQTHLVTTIDAADAPESLFALIATFLDLVRPGA